MSDTPEKPKKTHVDVRREAAQSFAVQIASALVPKDTTLEEAKVGELIDKIESIMLLAEKRGVHASIEFLNAYIKTLRLSLTNGVANHINQGVIHLAMWLDGSSNFITQGQQEAMRSPTPEEQDNVQADPKDEAKDKAPTEEKPKVVNIRKFLGQPPKDPGPGLPDTINPVSGEEN